MSNRIVTFGEIMLRLSKPGFDRLFQGRTFEGAYGGSEANVAVSLAMLGNDSRYVTRVPDNALGQAALMHLRQFGVDVSCAVMGGERLGSYYFERAAGLRNSQVVYDRAGSSFYMLQRGMIDWSHVLDGAQAFHCSGITCAVSHDALSSTLDGVEEASRMGLRIACDINYRKNLWNYGLKAHDVLHEVMQYSDFIFGDQNEWEVASAVPHIPFDAADAQFSIDVPAYRDYFEEMHRQFPRAKSMIMALRNQISSTHHTLTGLLWMEGKLYTTRIYDVQPLIDPMGVGDAFVAAYIHALLKWPAAPQYCLEFALSASALKNTIPGDQNLVTEQEVMDNMKAGSGRIDR